MGVWGSFLITAAALKTPTRNGYNAQGVNLTFRITPSSWAHPASPLRLVTGEATPLGNLVSIDITHCLQRPSQRQPDGSVRAGGDRELAPWMGRMAMAMGIYLYRPIYLYPYLYLSIHICIYIFLYLRIYIYT